MVTVEKVAMHIGKSEILQNISLQLPEKQLTAFIGPNGAGKSTLLSIMSRLTKQTEGVVYLQDTDILQWDQRELAKQIAILKQSSHISLKITVRELVSFGRFPYSQGRLTKQDEQFVEEALQQMDLTHMANRYIDQLSGGQRQRVLIAMILAQQTDYIYLDEPLNNLDMKHAVSLMKLFKQLVTDYGKTVVIVLHDINFAAAYADYIVALKDGKLHHHGTLETILQSNYLSELFELPIAVDTYNGRYFCHYY